MIEVPEEFSTLARIQRHIQWCESDGNLHSLTSTSYSIAPGEEIPTVPNPLMHQAGSSMENIMNSRVRAWGNSLPKPSEIEKRDVSNFCSYIDMAFLEAEDHQVLLYKEWKLANECVLETIELPEEHTGFYSAWIQELHQRFEAALKKEFDR